MKLIRIPAVTFPVNNNTRICLHFQRLSNLLVSWLKRKIKDTFNKENTVVNVIILKNICICYFSKYISEFWSFEYPFQTKNYK